MKSVVICSSSRFAIEARDFSRVLEKMGIVVFAPHFYRDSGGDWSAIGEFDKRFVALGLTHDHFYKICMADVVYIFNKDGYSGTSTTLEISYAVALNKPIYAFSDADEEICRRVLFSGIVATPEELMAKLQ
jgi:hypothetical protein